jgi:flagellar motor switch protein FliG
VTEIFAILKEALSLAILFFGEYYAEAKRKRLAGEKFEFDEATRDRVFQNVRQRMLDMAKKESEQAGRVEDQVDDAKRGRS